MSGRVPRRTLAPSRRSTPVASRLFGQRQMWTRLAAYRPLGVLASIWVGLLAIVLLAYGQLLRTHVDGAEGHTAGIEAYPHEQLDAAASPNATPDNAPAEELDSAAASETEAIATNELSFWTLVALVGTCAIGCWLLSVVLKSPRRVRRQTSPRPKKTRKQPLLGARQRGQGAAPTAQPGGAKVPRLDAYNPAQPLMAPPQPRPGTSAPQEPVLPPQSPPTSDVTVVSEQFQHRLDWPDTSLVNTEDVRQRRSLSSFL
ncbi:MAG: hypothetical protein AAF773_15805 [Cyanobacteria bacterium P01_D01_bin.115]